MAVVVVESPPKAKTINKYLGSNYTVLATFGHIRDLDEKSGSVDPDNNFSMKWQVNPKSQQHLKAIKKALDTDNHLILATDPDTLEVYVIYPLPDDFLEGFNCQLDWGVYPPVCRGSGKTGGPINNKRRIV